jgi:hypothetical protein
MAQKRLKIWGLLGGLVLIPCHTAMGQCAIENILKGDFPQSENQWSPLRKPWYAEGNVMIINGTVRSPDHTVGWHGIRQSVSLLANKGYALTAFVRTSRNMRDGHLGVRGAGLPKPVDMQFGPHTDRSMVRVMFTPAKAGNYDVFVGFWVVDKESSMEVDFVRLEPLSAGCSDVVTNPAALFF